MNIRDPRRRRLAANAARSGFLISAVAFVVTIFGTTATNVGTAGAATGGLAQVITPSDGTAGAGAVLAEGNSDTRFSLNLPPGAACSGDSATDNYRVYSYVVASSIDPASLTFDSNGPTNQNYQSASTYRAPILDQFATPYASQFTAEALGDPRPKPGQVINIAAFSWGALDLDPTVRADLHAGEYNIGIACWGPVGNSPVLDNYWNVRITVTDDGADPGPLDIKWTAQNPSSLSGTTTSTSSSSTSSSTSTSVGGSSTTTTSGSGATSSSTSMTSGGSTTSTTGGVGVLSAGGNNSGSGPSTGVGVGALARTGTSLSIAVWGVLMLVFGRMAVLLSKPPRVVAALA